LAEKIPSLVVLDTVVVVSSHQVKWENMPQITQEPATGTDRTRLTLMLNKETILYIKTMASANGLAPNGLIEKWVKEKQHSNN
jgi:hypothetical protein